MTIIRGVRVGKEVTEAQKADIADVLRRVRERVDARHPSLAGPMTTSGQRLASSSESTLYSTALMGIQSHIALCREIERSVGAVNPRPAGLVNNWIQAFKRLMARMLLWYTRPLKQFHGELINTLERGVDALRVVEVSTGSRTQSIELAQSRSTQHLNTLSQRVGALSEQLHALSERIEVVREKAPMEWLAKVDSHVGLKASAGLWFNEPVAVSYDDKSGATWSGTTERIIERAWVLRNLGDEPLGSKILDLGCAESTLALELASNGFRVTGIDVRDYPLKHPNLQFLRGDIGNSSLATDAFDIAIALSTVEHIGLGAYGDKPEETSDRKALDELFRLLKPGGRLLITVPFGRRAVTPLHRIYDPEALTFLLSKFVKVKLEFGIKIDGRTWVSSVDTTQAASQIHDPQTGGPGAVAMSVCRKPINL